jgi:hypothetical protein
VIAASANVGSSRAADSLRADAPLDADAAAARPAENDAAARRTLRSFSIALAVPTDASLGAEAPARSAGWPSSDSLAAAARSSGQSMLGSCATSSACAAALR